MAEKRGRGRPAAPKIVGEEEGIVKESIGENPSVVSVSSLSESQLARFRLRERWELASVLNFLHVFQPVIQSDLEMSAEEIETALISPNNALAELHISLLKGIPPVSKNLSGSNSWVTVLCKKLYTWWPWVAEGEIPLIAVHGEEISRYKELDPTIRLQLLKALCELRAHQDDILSYINDAMKHGTQLSTFRKDRIGGDGNGTNYWYDGDSVIGHRLYREVTKVEFMPRPKGKGRLTLPTNSFQWETLATNLEEFRQILDKFSSSKVMVEAAVGKIVENQIIPVLEGLEKKKERALKRQQRQTMLLSDFLSSYRVGSSRSCRDRRPVNYTFDEYDRSIDEAIELNKKWKTTHEQKHEGKDGEHEGRRGVASNSSSVQDGELMENEAVDDKFRGVGGDDDNDDDDDDYDGKSDDEDDNDDIGGNSDNSKEENSVHGMHQTRHSQKLKGPSAENVIGLRRSKRTAGHTSHPDVETINHADTKKMLRQRPTRNTNCDPLIVSDSEDENSSEHTGNEMLDNAEESLGALDGLLVESEEENSSVEGLPDGTNDG